MIDNRFFALGRAFVFSVALAMPFLAGCDGTINGNAAVENPGGQEDGQAEEDAYERGPHNGRMLRQGSLALEITIFEAGVPPQFRIFPYIDDRPAAPENVRLTVELGRLDGTVDRFTFTPESDYLVGDGVVTEPHSFDVRVVARHNGRKYEWAYPSYEGRTAIPDKMADEAGIEVAPAGPALIEETIDVLGRIDLAPGARATLRARFAGQVVAVHKTVGDRVRAGEPLARIESNESLRIYDVVSPFDGVVLERQTNAGDVAGPDALFVVGDITRLRVDFHIFPKDLRRVAPGQPVTVRSIDGRLTARTEIQTFLPTRELETQTVLARAALPNPDRVWMPGMTVGGDIVVDREEVPLAVRTQALQRFRDFTVVFVKVDETYEVRMLETGRQTEEWTEVLSGLRPGRDYVFRNSFIIKADIEKSGASHDH